MKGEELYSALLGEAEQSPNLLEDLAALEGYLSETYSSRAFIELLQNADDAGATTVEFSFNGTQLISSNNGKTFTANDVQGICRSGKSSKSRGSSIGYRGIGFKSTAALASQILVSSGDYCFKFSKELTARALASSKPMPLIRVPHFGKAADDEWAVFSNGNVLSPGQDTVFIFDVIDLVALAAEFENFRSDYLLFLNNVLEVRLNFRGSKRTFYRSKKDSSPTESTVTLGSSDSGETIWLVSGQATFSLACATVNDTPSPMRQESSLFHSFLPTTETTGLGVRINADFSTDPSRTKITLDEHTLEILQDVSAFVARTLISVAQGERNLIGGVIAPESMHAGFNQSNKSVKFVLQEMVKQHIRNHGALSNFRTRPSWIVGIDLRPNAALGNSVPRLVQTTNDEQISFFKSLGLKALSPGELLKYFEVSQWPKESRAALIGQVASASALATREDLELLTSTSIWESEDGRQRPLSDYLSQESKISMSFLDLLSKNGASIAFLKSMVQKVNQNFGELFNFAPNESAPIQEVNGWKLLSAPRAPTFPSMQGSPVIEEPMWRTAELFVLSSLRQAGYEANDVSRQFVGYDIHARKDEVEYFVEVKKVSTFAEPFSLTSNEQAFASQMGAKFVLAIVSLSADGSRSTLAFIANPTAKLGFERQCQKWVWECSNYREFLQEGIAP